MQTLNRGVDSSRSRSFVAVADVFPPTVELFICEAVGALDFVAKCFLGGAADLDFDF